MHLPYACHNSTSQPTSYIIQHNSQVPLSVRLERLHSSALIICMCACTADHLYSCAVHDENELPRASIYYYAPKTINVPSYQFDMYSSVASENFLDTLGGENGLLYRGFHNPDVILHA